MMVKAKVCAERSIRINVGDIESVMFCDIVPRRYVGCGAEESPVILELLDGWYIWSRTKERTRKREGQMQSQERPLYLKNLVLATFLLQLEQWR